MGSKTCRKPNDHHNGRCPTCGSWCNWCPDTPSARGTERAEALREAAGMVEALIADWPGIPSAARPSLRDELRGLAAKLKEMADA